MFYEELAQVVRSDFRFGVEGPRVDDPELDFVVPRVAGVGRCGVKVRPATDSTGK